MTPPRGLNASTPLRTRATVDKPRVRVRAVSHPRRPRVCCPGKKARTNADSASQYVRWRRTAKAPNGGAVRPQELLNHTRLKRAGAARGDCPSTGLVDAPCTSRGDDVPNRKTRRRIHNENYSNYANSTHTLSTRLRHRPDRGNRGPGDDSR